MIFYRYFSKQTNYYFALINFSSTTEPPRIPNNLISLDFGFNTLPLIINIYDGLIFDDSLSDFQRSLIRCAMIWRSLTRRLLVQRSKGKPRLDIGLIIKQILWEKYSVNPIRSWNPNGIPNMQWLRILKTSRDILTRSLHRIIYFSIFKSRFWFEGYGYTLRMFFRFFENKEFPENNIHKKVNKITHVKGLIVIICNNYQLLQTYVVKGWNKNYNSTDWRIGALVWKWRVLLWYSNLWL